MFHRETSSVTWCEPKYVVTDFIAEFGNTVSNVIYITFPPILMYLYRYYGKQISLAIHAVWILMIIVGAASAYFHSTLSLFGQLLDEISIIWVIALGTALFFPRRYILPHILKKKRNLFHWLIGIVAGVSTILSFIQPKFNAMIMISFGMIYVPYVLAELRRCHMTQETEAFGLLIRALFLYALAILSWWGDRLFCEFWIYWNIPYLHCLWHILIFLASYSVLTVSAYLWAKSEWPELIPILSFWPRSKYNWGIAYVLLSRDRTVPSLKSQ